MSSPDSSRPPVQAVDLAKSYGNVTAVAGSSFEVADGEVFGVVGPNGAGKTTTLKMLAGLITPTAGEAYIAGHPSTTTEMQHHLGFLPEDSPLYDDMTGVNYLRFFADLYDVDSEVAITRIHDVLDRLQLDDRTRKIGNMSKGMKRKVAIARSLVNDPEVLVYDEPASGLDPLSTHKIIEFTESLAADGKTIIFSAHNLHHVERLCDRVLIMSNGESIARGPLDDIRETHGATTYTLSLSDPIPESETVNGTPQLTVESMAAVREIEAQLANRDGRITDITTEESSLEDIFLSLSDNQ